MKRDLTSVRILIVEDDLALLKVLNSYLIKCGAIVYQATNGEIAYGLVEKHEIDFVLSDIQMPVMSGVELLKKIRLMRSHIPIVLLATGQAELTQKEAIEFGAAGLIHKPFGLKFLNEEIIKLINKKI